MKIIENIEYNEKKELISLTDDLSANKNASQFRINISCPTCVATNAVDRNVSTCTRTELGQTSSDQITWWYVDLGAVQSVYNIRIQFKDYAGHSKSTFTIHN